MSHISIKQKKNAGFFFPKLIYKCLTLIITIQVFRLCYCVPFSVKDITHWKTVCNEFLETTAKYMPEFSKSLKTHLVLHLVDSIINFGPTQCYNTERYANESLHFIIKSLDMNHSIHWSEHRMSLETSNRLAKILPTILLSFNILGTFVLEGHLVMDKGMMHGSCIFIRAILY